MAKVNTIGDALTEEQKKNLTAGARPYNPTNKVNGIPEAAARFPEHFVKIAMLLKNNAEIRRFTSLGIINYLKQKGSIEKDAKAHVDFKWNKFAVSSNQLTTEYSYKQQFFINCLVNSFTSFANSAQETISDFVAKEIPDYVVPESAE